MTCGHGRNSAALMTPPCTPSLLGGSVAAAAAAAATADMFAMDAPSLSVDDSPLFDDSL